MSPNSKCADSIPRFDSTQSQVQMDLATGWFIKANSAESD